mmetsp:Transcript_21820/g.30829  ORF Transcript_21820/g.30829 Transcript_21820/m.30829 type:complete len:305 (+) Transcript_21820:399-1313(+)
MERHSPPRVVFGSRLREPHVASIACQVARLESVRDSIAVTDLAPGGIDDVGATFHLGDHVSVEEVLRLRVERAVDSHYIADLDHVFDFGVVSQVQLFFDRLGEAVAVSVVELAAKGVHTAQNSQTDTARGDGPDVHTFNVVSALYAVSDVPAAVDDLVVTRDVVADQRQDHHADVFGDRDGVAEGHFRHSHVSLDGSVEVHVVGTDTSSQAHLEVRGAGDPLCGDVVRVERLGDDHFRVHELFVHSAPFAVFVGCHHQSVATVFQEFAKTELARNAAQELPRVKVHRGRSRGGLPVRVARDVRD